MYTLIVRGPRRAVLAVHRCSSSAELEELTAVYRVLGYADDALTVEASEQEQAA